MSIKSKVLNVNRPTPGIVQVSDVTLNDSDKSFVVPSGVTHRILCGNVDYTTSATVTSRQLEFHILDESSNILYKMSAGSTHSPSLTVNYGLLTAGVRNTSLVNGELIVPIPVDCALKSGWSLRIFDSAAIDPAADDMLVRLIVEEIEE